MTIRNSPSLALCPCADANEGFSPNDSTVMAFNRLSVDSGDGFEDKVLALASEPLPYFEEEDVNIDFNWYDCEAGAISREKDNCGQPIRYVLAKQFNEIDSSSFSVWNKAVLAFVNGLPPNMPVVLYRY